MNVVHIKLPAFKGERCQGPPRTSKQMCWSYFYTSGSVQRCDRCCVAESFLWGWVQATFHLRSKSKTGWWVIFLLRMFDLCSVAGWLQFYSFVEFLEIFRGSWTTVKLESIPICHYFCFVRHVWVGFVRNYKKKRKICFCSDMLTDEWDGCCFFTSFCIVRLQDCGVVVDF